MPSDCRWSATHDHMPGPDAKRTLRVYGECTCPTPEYVLTLAFKEPQGINPENLLLELTAKAPDMGVPDVVSPCVAEFSLETDTEYETVTILGDGGGTVEVVHTE